MTIKRKWILSWVLLLACLTGMAIWYCGRPSDPVYQGKRLSKWAAEVATLDRLEKIVNGNHPQVLAMRAIGTNAIPWLLSEMKKSPPLRWQLNELLEKQPVIKFRFKVTAEARDLHQFQARCGFWALGEIGEPAIPKLVGMIERKPDFAPSALAGIGAPALHTLHDCLTNIPTNVAATDPRIKQAEGIIGSLFVAVDVGRVSQADAAFLIPSVQAWAQQRNRAPAYWAEGFLREFEHQKTEP